MKLYTEEQVRKVLWEFGDLLFNNCQDGIKEDDLETYLDIAIEDEPSIELPSDDEMANASNHCKDGQVKVGFLRGVLWYQEQILNQNHIGGVNEMINQNK